MLENSFLTNIHNQILSQWYVLLARLKYRGLPAHVPQKAVELIILSYRLRSYALSNFPICLVVLLPIGSFRLFKWQHLPS